VTNAPRIEPWDEHNQRLISLVHPQDWVNPTSKDRYHLLVIGAGTGGLVTAAIAAGLGARVALIERHLMGGDCLNVGCVPSKALLGAARMWQAARDAPPRFGGPMVSGVGDFAAVMERLRHLRAELSPADSAMRFRELGVDVFFGEAHFVATNAVEVGRQRLLFRRAVIATGGRPGVPPVPGLSAATCYTNETIFSLTALPARLVVIGGGAIGCELAQAFARFGARVTVLEQAPRILPNDDAQAAEVVRGALQRDGVQVITGVRVVRVERGPTGRVVYEPPGADLLTDEILVAAGRLPNVEALQLEAARVAYDTRGVVVDERMRTSNPRVYAIGDVCSRFKFTHVADAQARLVVQNALFFGRGKSSRLIVPWCTYTSPEVAQVGITAEHAAARSDVDTITVPMHEIDRARLDGQTDGFLRLHLRRDSDQILGATLVCEHAGDILTQITTALVNRLGLSALGKAIYPYPTLAEAIRKAADAHRRQRLTPAKRKVFALFFRVVR
jgi:pyruvate/2-oxoglutarate dehydrogenase complex dihydrolipoamide dehydrogenase (E3) component